PGRRRAEGGRAGHRPDRVGRRLACCLADARPITPRACRPPARGGPAGRPRPGFAPAGPRRPAAYVWTIKTIRSIISLSGMQFLLPTVINLEALGRRDRKSVV